MVAGTSICNNAVMRFLLLRCCCSLPSHLFSSSLCSSTHTDDEDEKIESEPRSTVYGRHGQTAARGPYAARSTLSSGPQITYIYKPAQLLLLALKQSLKSHNVNIVWGKKTTKSCGRGSDKLVGEFQSRLFMSVFAIFFFFSQGLPVQGPSAHYKTKYDG